MGYSMRRKILHTHTQLRGTLGKKGLVNRKICVLTWRVGKISGVELLLGWTVQGEEQHEQNHRGERLSLA